MRPLVYIAALAVTCSAGATVLLQRDQQRTVAESAARTTGGDPERGQKLLVIYGCGGCHDVPRMRGPKKHVGPSLSSFAQRMYVSGTTENKPDALIAFLNNPRAMVPSGAMPNLYIADADARDLAAWSYTQRPSELR